VAGILERREHRRQPDAAPSRPACRRRSAPHGPVRSGGAPDLSGKSVYLGVARTTRSWPPKRRCVERLFRDW
jgi:hypothetical protein